MFNRGIRKQNIFLEDRDYKRYIDRMREYKDKHNISILAYCLMPNHVHLLIRQNGPQPASQFIQRLHTAYTMYFNKKYALVGHPFQGRFKTKMVSRDEYLMHLSRYIHLNPKKLVTKLPSYKWSSYPAYLEENNDNLLDTKLILEMFKTKNGKLEDARLSYKGFVKSQDEFFDNIQHLILPHDS
jgi:REP element-mobilizing transposase RayT